MYNAKKMKTEFGQPARERHRLIVGVVVNFMNPAKKQPLEHYKTGQAAIRHSVAGDQVVEHVRGCIPYGSMYVPFTYTLSRSGFNTNGVIVYPLQAPPYVTKSRINIRLRVLHECMVKHIPANEQARLPEGFLDKYGHLYVNIYAVLREQDARKSAITHDNASKTSYNKLLSDALNMLKVVINSNIVEATAYIAAQLSPLFAQLFNLSIFDLQALPLKDVILYTMRLFREGVHVAFRPVTFLISVDNKSGKSKVDVSENGDDETMLDAADEEKEDEKPADSWRSGFRGPTAATVKSDNELSKDDMENADGAQVSTKKIVLRMQFKRAMMLYKTETLGGEGLRAMAYAEEEEDGCVNEIVEKIESDAVSSMMYAANPGLKRKQDSLNESTANFEFWNLDKSACLIASHVRPTQCPFPLFANIPDTVWCEEAILAYVVDSYLTHQSQCLPVRDFDATRVLSNEDFLNSCPIPLTADLIRDALLSLVGEKRLTMYDIVNKREVSKIELAQLLTSQTFFTSADHFVAIPWIMRVERKVANSLSMHLRNDSIRRVRVASQFIDTLDSNALFDCNDKPLQLSQQQCLAMARAVVMPISVICGPAGTGKSTTIKAVIAMARRLQEYERKTGDLNPENDAKLILLTCFKNETDGANKRIITTSADMVNAGNLDVECRTTDYLLTKYKKGGGNRYEYHTIICEESSMFSTEHVTLISCCDIAKLRRIVYIGDTGQLHSITPGRPFEDLIDSMGDRGVTRLTINFRAKFERLMKLQTDIRERKIDELEFDEKLPAKEQRLFWVKNVSDMWHTSDDCMYDFASKVMNKIDELDPKMTMDFYRGLMLTCPFTVFSRFISQVVTKMYFPEVFTRTQEEMLRYAKSPTKAWFPPVVTGGKVTARETNKKLRLCASQRYMVTSIFDHPLNCEDSALPGYNSDRLRHHAQERCKTEESTVAMQRTILLDDDIYIRFSDPGDIYKLFEVGDCQTVHNVQGNEANTVFVLLPKSKNLISNNMLYTAVTRARERLVVFATPDMLMEYITTDTPTCVRLLPCLLTRELDKNLLTCYEDMAHRLNSKVWEMIAMRDLAQTVFKEGDDDGEHTFDMPEGTSGLNFLGLPISQADDIVLDTDTED